MTVKPITPPNVLIEKQTEIRKRQNHRLFQYLKDAMGYPVREIQEESGIGEQIIYKWLSEDPPQPQQKNKNKILTWLGLPEEEFENFLNDETYHPEKLLQKQGQVLYDDTIVNEMVENAERLTLKQIFKVKSALDSILQSKVLPCSELHHTEENYVELNEREVARLKKMINLTLFVQDMTVEDLLKECYYTPAINEILDKNLEYQYPEEDLEPLLPFLPKVKTWNGVTPQAFEEFGIGSIEEMKEILNR